jgi:hypothetical protein
MRRPRPAKYHQSDVSKRVRLKRYAQMPPRSVVRQRHDASLAVVPSAAGGSGKRSDGRYERVTAKSQDRRSKADLPEAEAADAYA